MPGLLQMVMTSARARENHETLSPCTDSVARKVSSSRLRAAMVSVSSLASRSESMVRSASKLEARR
eukprot:3982453-Alexandrium_andersonii.AAC.1